MKILFKYTFRLAMLACVSASFSGCEQDPKFRVYDYPVPVVEKIYPTDGFVTTQVVITGTNFGDRTEAVKVFFGGAQSTKVVDCKNNRLVVEVPETAVTGDLSLQIYNKKVENIGYYTVLPTPRIIAMNSETGGGMADAGEKVTIIGENFGTDESDISVSFNGTSAQFKLVDESTIIATTPEHYETGEVTVTIHGYTLVAGVMLNPNVKGDVTSFYLKNYKQPFLAEGAVSGDWSDARYWNQNAASKNPTGCRQAQANKPVYLAFQNGWGKSVITNGKVWQTTTLRAGTYALEVFYSSTKLPNSDNNAFYTVIVPGTDDTAIPDVENVANITAAGGYYTAFTDWSGNTEKEGTLTTEFTLDESMEMVIGFLMNVASKDTYFKVTEVKLTLK